MFNPNDDPNRVNPPEEDIIDLVRDTDHYQNALQEEIIIKKEYLRKNKDFRKNLIEHVTEDIDDDLVSLLVELSFDSLNTFLAQKLAIDVRKRCEKLIDKKAEELGEESVDLRYRWRSRS